MTMRDRKYESAKKGGLVAHGPSASETVRPRGRIKSRLLGMALMISMAMITIWSGYEHSFLNLVLVVVTFYAAHEILHAIGWRYFTGNWPEFHWNNFAQVGRGSFSADALRAVLLLPTPLIPGIILCSFFIGATHIPSAVAALVILTIGSAGDYRALRDIKGIPGETKMVDALSGATALKDVPHFV